MVRVADFSEIRKLITFRTPSNNLTSFRFDILELVVRINYAYPVGTGHMGLVFRLRSRTFVQVPVVWRIRQAVAYSTLLIAAISQRSG